MKFILVLISALIILIMGLVALFLGIKKKDKKYILISILSLLLTGSIIINIYFWMLYLVDKSGQIPFIVR